MGSDPVEASEIIVPGFNSFPLIKQQLQRSHSLVLLHLLDKSSKRSRPLSATRKSKEKDDMDRNAEEVFKAMAKENQTIGKWPRLYFFRDKCTLLPVEHLNFSVSVQKYLIDCCEYGENAKGVNSIKHLVYFTRNTLKYTVIQ